MEIKALGVPSQFKGVNGRTATGLFSLYGNIDSTGDIVHPGAAAGVQASKLLFLWQHDFSSPPTAQIKSVREIGRAQLPQAIRTAYPEATGGLEAEREYLPTPRGEEVLANIKAGVPLGASFGFNAKVYDFTKGPNGEQIRNLRGIEWLELSDVLWGANPGAMADSTRGAPASTRAWLAAAWLECAALQLSLIDPTGAPPVRKAAGSLTTRRLERK